jgi:hypothetical protein
MTNESRIFYLRQNIKNFKHYQPEGAFSQLFHVVHRIETGRTHEPTLIYGIGENRGMMNGKVPGKGKASPC